jgi:hypothetical protein
VAQAQSRGPDDRMGEVGPFVSRPTGPIPTRRVVAWAGAHGQLQAPRVVEVVDGCRCLGKVLKFELRDRAVSSLQQGMTGDRT